MITLALDQALNTTGWAIFKNDRLIDYGTFSTKQSDPIGFKLGNIWTNLNNLSRQYNFEHIFFEDTQKQVNVETWRKLCYVQATIILWSYWKADIPYTVLAPSHWRKIISDKYKIKFGTKREEQKKAAQQFIEQRYDLKVTSDEADAICIGAAGLIEYNKNRSAF